MQYILEHIESGETYHGSSIEFFVDDELLIGEVYLDGELIFQEMDIIDEEQLEFAFNKSFIQLESDDRDDTWSPF